MSIDSELEQIVRNITSAFTEDPGLKSFDVVFQPSPSKSPVLHIQHNLGLESWCIKNLYLYIHQKILNETTELKKKISFLTTALLLNPCVCTFWNMRRKLVIADNLQLDSELHFTAVVLSYKPNEQNIFNYRKWLYKKIFGSDQYVQNVTMNVNNEFALIGKAAESHSNNYVAWDYGVWFLKHNCSSVDLMHEMWKFNENYIFQNVSDCGSFHFRQKIIGIILTKLDYLDSFSQLRNNEINSNNFCKLLNEDQSKMILSNNLLINAIGLIFYELSVNENLNCFYENVESIWNYRRFLYYIILKFILNLFPNENQSQLVSILFQLLSHTHKIFVSKIGNKNSHLNKFNEWLKNFFNFYVTS